MENTKFENIYRHNISFSPNIILFVLKDGPSKKSPRSFFVLPFFHSVVTFSRYNILRHTHTYIYVYVIYAIRLCFFIIYLTSIFCCLATVHLRHVTVTSSAWSLSSVTVTYLCVYIHVRILLSCISYLYFLF